MEFFEFARDSGNVGVGLMQPGALETKSAAAVGACSANFRGLAMAFMTPPDSAS